MQIMEEGKIVENIVKALDEIKEKFSVEVIKEYQMPPLVNVNTGVTTGLAVVIKLNTKYEYGEDIFNDWKGRMQADGWYIRVRSNQLYVTFRIHYFVPTEKHIARMSHAIGLDNKQPGHGCYEAYRNGSFYSDPVDEWDELVVAGYAYDCRKEKDYRYHVSPKGFRFLARHYNMTIRFTNEYDGRD